MNAVLFVCLLTIGTEFSREDRIAILDEATRMTREMGTRDDCYERAMASLARGETPASCAAAWAEETEFGASPGEASATRVSPAILSPGRSARFVIRTGPDFSPEQTIEIIFRTISDSWIVLAAGTSGWDSTLEIRAPVPYGLPTGPCEVEILGRRWTMPVDAENPRVSLEVSPRPGVAAGEELWVEAAGLPLPEYTLFSGDSSAILAAGGRATPSGYTGADGNTRQTIWAEFPGSDRMIRARVIGVGADLTIEVPFENWSSRVRIPIPSGIRSETVVILVDGSETAEILLEPFPAQSIPEDWIFAGGEVVSVRPLDRKIWIPADWPDPSESWTLVVPTPHGTRRVEGRPERRLLRFGRRITSWLKFLSFEIPRDLMSGDHMGVLLGQVGRYSYFLQPRVLVENSGAPHFPTDVCRFESFHSFFFEEGDGAAYRFRPGDLAISDPRIEIGDTIEVRLLRTQETGTPESWRHRRDAWITLVAIADSPHLAVVATPPDTYEPVVHLRSPRFGSGTLVTTISGWLGPTPDPIGTACFTPPSTGLLADLARKIDSWIAEGAQAPSRPSRSPWGGNLSILPTPAHPSYTAHAYDAGGRLVASYHVGPIGRRAVEYAALGGETVAWCATDLLWTAPWDPPHLGTVWADAFRMMTVADAGAMNALGLRGDLPTGPITRARIDFVSPFDNRVLVVEVSARDLAAEIARKREGYQYLHLSGVRVEEDSSAIRLFGPRGEFAPDSTLRIAVPDYIARSGTGYPAFATARRIPSPHVGEKVNDVVEAYLRRIGVVPPRRP